MVNWRDYIVLCKAKVVMLMLLTTLVGMFLAVPGLIPWPKLIATLLGIGLVASAAAVLNHMVDHKIDAIMRRTKRRPLVTGQIDLRQAAYFALTLGAFGLLTLIYAVNVLTAVLSFLTLVVYAVIYTVYLKPRTPQNIVIGGIAGAVPPLLGWTAMSGHIVANSLLLVLIIFVWTPPHFWALAIYRYDDYARAEVPMLPVYYDVHLTTLHILLYTILLFIVSLFPFIVGMSSYWYLSGAIALGTGFLYWAIRLWRSGDAKIARQTFRYSIIYLLWLFLFLLVDHWMT